jgi:hypothetical protein
MKCIAAPSLADGASRRPRGAMQQIQYTLRPQRSSRLGLAARMALA